MYYRCCPRFDPTESKKLVAGSIPKKVLESMRANFGGRSGLSRTARLQWRVPTAKTAPILIKRKSRFCGQRHSCFSRSQVQSVVSALQHVQHISSIYGQYNLRRFFLAMTENLNCLSAIFVLCSCAATLTTVEISIGNSRGGTATEAKQKKPNLATLQVPSVKFCSRTIRFNKKHQTKDEAKHRELCKRSASGALGRQEADFYNCMWPCLLFSVSPCMLSVPHR